MAPLLLFFLWAQLTSRLPLLHCTSSHRDHCLIDSCLHGICTYSRVVILRVTDLFDSCARPDHAPVRAPAYSCPVCAWLSPGVHGVWRAWHEYQLSGCRAGCRGSSWGDGQDMRSDS